MQWLRSLFQRRQIYSDLAEEIQQHLAEKVEALMADGMSRKDAEYAAKREFGNIARIEESGHEPWMWPHAESILADIRFALRILFRNAGFTTWPFLPWHSASVSIRLPLLPTRPSWPDPSTLETPAAWWISR